MTRDEIAAQAEQEKKERSTLCTNEVNAVLEKYQCEIAAIPQFIPDGNGWKIVTTVHLIAK